MSFARLRAAGRCTTRNSKGQGKLCVGKLRRRYGTQTNSEYSKHEIARTCVHGLNWSHPSECLSQMVLACTCNYPLDETTIDQEIICHVPAHSLHSDWGKMFKGFNVVAVYQRQGRNGFQSLYSNVFWRFLLAHSLPNPITIILLNMCWGFSKKWSERESKQKPWKGLAFLAIDETSEGNKRLLHNVDVVVKIWTERKPQKKIEGCKIKNDSKHKGI